MLKKPGKTRSLRNFGNKKTWNLELKSLNLKFLTKTTK